MKVIIVGAVAGGATAAARLRRLDEDAEIILFERDEYISFANCGLPYYIGGVIKDRSRLLVQTVEAMSARFNLDIRNLTEVVAVNRDKKTVTAFNKQKNETYEESYDVLILSPGAKPLKPPIPGIGEAENLFVLRNIPDTDAIKTFTDEKKPKNAVVVGGGFIGVEMAENLSERGIKVTLVEKLPQVMRNLDYEMAQFVHQELNFRGIELLLGEEVSEFKQNGAVVALKSGKELSSDMTILSIGVTPENTLAKNAGLALGPRGHIKTTKTLQGIDAATGETINDIYVIGDAIEVSDRVTGNPTAIPLAWPANRQGRLVADHIAGLPAEYGGSLGTAVAKVFDLTVASTGNNEAQLKEKGISYRAIHAHRANHASYYPDAQNIALKLLFSPETGKIFGAQAVGREGTEKRIDLIAAAIRLGGTVRELCDLEICYAPPYSSAKDPVNILGYIATNTMTNAYKFIQYSEVDKLVEDGAFLLDVRTGIEYSTGSIKGSVNIPLSELRGRLNELPQDKNAPIIVSCQVGLTAHVALMLLKGKGYTNLSNLSGGFVTYKTANYKPTVSKDETKFAKSEVNTDMNSMSDIKTIEVDVCGLQCPGPLMATHNAVKSAAEGEQIRIISTDFGFAKDVESWCAANGHKLLSLTNDKGKYIALLQKGGKPAASACAVPSQENATIVVFSGELDKALASMIIAQGAVASGKKVTIFFTFWGLNTLRKTNHVPVKKNFIEKMFGFMMPRGAKRLPLSNMNMLGMGPKMIKSIMKQKNVDDIETMIKKAMSEGVRFVACTMSMDLMGIKKEELIDGIEYGGVATYIASNENVGTTLFI